MTAKVRKFRRRTGNRKSSMPKLKEMFLKEYESLKVNRDIMGRVPEDILIGIKFSDNHFHGVYPDEEATGWILNELLDQNPEFEAVEDGGEEYLGQEILVKSELPKKIIFHNRQAIGDILMMTCAVRDFKKRYPEVDVKVQSTAMHIWDNSPHIIHEEFTEVIDPAHDMKAKDMAPQIQRKYVDRAVEEDRPVKLYIGPGKGTNQSNSSDLHFANAYRLSIEAILGVNIPQGPIRPDVHLSPKEELNPIITPPYWVICAGEKGDWTAKTWPQMWWQEIVNLLPDVQFVQIGQEGRGHRVLEGDNVINFIGRTEDRNTGIRDLFNIFYHSDGSIGLVSFHMHLSAAFNNPCVVIAGAREPQHFTHYPGHRYLSTDGCLPCTVRGEKPRACWYCDVDRCEFVINVEGQKVPRCMEMIRPTDVAKAVNMYYRGGRLSDTAGKNKKRIPPLTVGEGRESTPASKKSDDEIDVYDELIAEWGFSWGGTSITRPDWDFIRSIINRYKVKTVLEFGCGLSTLLFRSVGYDVTSYEADNYGTWTDKLKGINPKLDLREWDAKSEVEGGDYDLIFVDGPSGSIRREISIKQSAELADLIIVHDAGRKLELEYQEKYLKPYFELRDKGGTRCHFWSRRDAIAVEDVKKASRKIEESGETLPPFAHHGVKLNIETEGVDKESLIEGGIDYAEKKIKEFDGIGKRGAEIGKKLADELKDKVELPNNVRFLPSKGKVRLVFNGRGEGGAERSTTWLMKTFDQMGYEVEYVTPTAPSGTFRKADDTDRIRVLDFNKWSVQEEVDLLILYVNDWVWDFNKTRVIEPFEVMKAKRKVMVVNFRIGKIGRIPWTLGWDKYIFLNTSLYKSLRELETEAPMKVLPPPTDLTEFLKIKPDYDGAMRIVRHSSQGDVKYSKDFPDKCYQICDRINSVSISLMPAPSFLPDGDERIIHYKRNQPPVPEFLSQGNVFWYWLPEGYEDQGPKVIMEAQAAGLPIVAQDHSGPRDRVKDTGSGFLSNNFNDHLYYFELLRDSKVREDIGKIGKEHARKNYDPHRWIEEILRG